MATITFGIDNVTPRLRQAIFDQLGNSTSLFPAAYRFMGSKKELLVTSKTDVVIEGYPRSGNTFAVVAFRHAQPDPAELVIAHHLHVPAQIGLAARYGIPTMVVVRQPDAAIPSLIVRESHVSIDRALRKYIDFHRTVLTHRSTLLTVKFESVITDFGVVMQHFNERFGTHYKPFEHTPVNVEAVFASLDELEKSADTDEVQEEKVSRPSDSRKALLRGVVQQLNLPRYADRLRECVDLCERLRAQADC